MGQTRWYWGLLGNLISWLVNSIVRKEGAENIAKVDKLLAQGKSVLIYNNHPSSVAVGYMHPVFLKLKNRNRAATGALITYKFADGRMGMPGKIVLSVFTGIKLTALYVVQAKDKTIEMDLRGKINREASESAMRFLNQPGGVVLIYPEATRSQGGLIEAQQGLGRFALHADYVWPVVSPYPVWKYLPFLTLGKVRYLEPIAMESLTPMIKEMGKTAFSSCFAEYLMSWLGAHVPTERRGFYRDRAAWFVGKIGEYSFFKIHEILTKS